jgi:hypothetical protein
VRIIFAVHPVRGDQEGLSGPSPRQSGQWPDQVSQDQAQASQGQAVQGQAVQGQAVQGLAVQGQAVHGQAVHGQGTDVPEEDIPRQSGGWFEDLHSDYGNAQYS